MINDILVHFNVFILVTFRTVAFIAASPLISMNVWPNWAKIGLALGLSYIVVPTITNPVPNLSNQPGEFIVFALLEALVGLALGFIATMIFSVIAIAGQIIDIQIGFSLAEVLSPGSTVPAGLFGNFYNVLFTLYFVGMGGLDGLMLAILHSFAVVPLGQFHLTPDWPGVLLNLLGLVMTLAVELSAPLLVALFLTDVTFALLSRAVPQMNVFVVGLPAKIFVGLSVFAIVLPGTVYVFNQIFMFLFSQLQAVLQSMGG